MKKTFKNFDVSGNKYLPSYIVGEVVPKLPPGSYTLNFNSNNGTFWFEEKPFVSDSIIDLPSPEYSQVIKDMTVFMTDRVKKLYSLGGYVYKRSVLLHGLPGTGKTIIVNRVAKDIIKLGGICLWVTESHLLAAAFDILNDIQPDIITGVIFEEFDNMVKRQESNLLTLLDGQVQKNNVIYLATTNYIDKIPKRMYRPGRMSSVVEVRYPTSNARKIYIDLKLKQLGMVDYDLEKRVKETKGLSIDEIKEVIQSVDILGNDIVSVIKKIKSVRSSAQESSTNTPSHNDFEDIRNIDLDEQ